VLLKKIKAEKERLIKKKKIRKVKPLALIELDEVPYQLPDGWEWVRLGHISEVIMGQSPPGITYNDVGEGVPLVNGPVEFSKGDFGKTKKTKFTTKPTKLCEKNDLLLCVRGSTTGRTNIANFDACIGRGVAAIRSKINPKYLNWLMVSLRTHILSIGTGSTFPSVSYDKIVGLVCFLPPLSEQKRIVFKIDKLMAFCDKLETKLAQSQSDCDTLLSAISNSIDNRLGKRKI
jgi:type I restriction enzyme S subunit